MCAIELSEELKVVLTETPENLERILKEAESVFKKAYKEISKKLEGKISDPKKRIDIARRAAHKKMNRWLEQNYGITYEVLNAKITASKTDVSLEALAAG